MKINIQDKHENLKSYKMNSGKEPNSNTQNFIIKLLRKNKTMRYSDIKNKVMVTDATMSKSLSVLINEGSIEYEKRGREKHYKISDKIKNTFYRRMSVLSYDYCDYIIDEYPLTTNEDFFETLEKKIIPFLMFTVLNSMQTGENWASSFKSDDIIRVLLDYVILNIFYELEISEEILVNDLHELRLEDYFPLVKEKIKYKHQDKITLMYESLRKLYPNEVQTLERLSK